MLKESNDNKLSSKKVDSKYVPFYQVWQELVNPQTLDVYQYRVLTSISALMELDAVIVKTIQGLFTSDANIEACREETLYILNQDRVLEKYHKPILNRLRASLGKKPSSHADKNRLLHQIRYSVNILAPNYLTHVLFELKSSIDNENTQDIEYYANITASQAINNGWSPRALLDVLRHFQNNKAFETKWEDFKRNITDLAMYQHVVYINVPFPQGNEEEQAQQIEALERLDITPKTHAQIVSDHPNISDLGELLKAEKRYFCVQVNAKDIYSAAHMAIARLSSELNIASFYNLVDAWDLKSVVIVAINTVTTYHRSFTAEYLYSTYDHVDSSSRVFESTRRIFADSSKQILRGKLQGAFSYTNISRASLFQEEKYMNLWVALESLARTNMYSDIISNVKETVPAALCVRYVYRIVRNFVEDCKRCRVELVFEGTQIDTEQPTKQKMVKEAIALLRDQTLFQQMLVKCEVNSLLHHRCQDVHKLVTDIDFAKRKLENHYKRVNWQIQRLYRIRNEIAHAALQEQTSLIVYIEHLYDYLSTYITEIITCITERKMDSLEEALCSIKDNYDVFISLYQDNDKQRLTDTVLSTGIISLL